MTFITLALAEPAQAATKNIAILALQPPLSPPTPLPPRRAGKGSQQPYLANAFAGLSSRATGNIQTCREPHEFVDAVPAHFECWPSTLNSPPKKTRPHTAVGPPFPPGGAGEGLGVRVGVVTQKYYIFSSCLRSLDKG